MRWYKYNKREITQNCNFSKIKELIKENFLVQYSHTGRSQEKGLPRKRPNNNLRKEFKFG